MGFNLGLTLFTGVLFGLAPALQFSRPDLNHALKEGAADSAKGFRFVLRRGTQSLLVIGEVALALALLVGAGDLRGHRVAADWCRFYCQFHSRVARNEG